MNTAQVYDAAMKAQVECELDGDVVRYYETFDTDDEYEPQDVAWDLYCAAQERCNEHGIQIIDYDSDNDSCMGVIVAKE
jgi:hypothetical protein